MHVSYDGRSIVTVRQSTGIVDWSDTYYAADAIRQLFSRSKAGSDWGGDGIGAYAQQKAGVVEVKRSGVGPRKYAAALASLPAGVTYDSPGRK